MNNRVPPFPVGMCLPGAVILAVTPGKRCWQSRYRIRFDCCGSETEITHLSAYTWLHRTQRATRNRLTDLCRTCAQRARFAKPAAVEPEPITTDLINALFRSLARPSRSAA